MTMTYPFTEEQMNSAADEWGCNCGPSALAFALQKPQERPALMRVQWTGPWTQPGVNPKWAYRMTHWVTIWKERVAHLVFDCNGGVRDLASWCDEIVPVLWTLGDKLAQGGAGSRQSE